MKHNFKVEKSGIRLDKFIVDSLEGCSRQKAREACEKRLALVNGRWEKPGIILVPGDEVEVDDQFLQVAAAAENWSEDQEFDCLHEDPFLVVVNKPRGMHCVRLHHDDSSTLSDFLTYSYPQTAEASPDERESGLVQRLDYWTSGAIIAAKSREAHEALRKVFQSDSVAKSYLAVVEGELKTEFASRCYLVAKPGAKKVTCYPDEPDRGESWPVRSLIEGLAYNKEAGASLVRVKMHSAKRHQVRAQLAFEGFPLVGDELYGSSKTLGDIGFEQEGFLLLAESISLSHPLKKASIFVSASEPLISEFAARCGLEI